MADAAVSGAAAAAGGYHSQMPLRRSAVVRSARQALNSPVPLGARDSLLVILALVAISGCDQAPRHGIVLDPASVAPPLVLARVNGAPFELAAQRGRAVLIYFGYTHCPDVCPTVMADWARARRALGADTARVTFAFVSVDPGRDTPMSTQAYARQFDSAFVGLAMTDADFARITRDWGISAYPEADPRTKEYSVAHPAHTFAVDAKGRLRLMVPPGVSANDLADDLRRLR